MVLAAEVIGAGLKPALGLAERTRPRRPFWQPSAPTCGSVWQNEPKHVAAVHFGRTNPSTAMPFWPNEPSSTKSTDAAWSRGLAERTQACRRAVQFGRTNPSASHGRRRHSLPRLEDRKYRYATLQYRRTIFLFCRHYCTEMK